MDLLELPSCSNGSSKSRLVIFHIAGPGSANARKLTFKSTMLMAFVTSKTQSSNKSLLGGEYAGRLLNRFPNAIGFQTTCTIAALIEDGIETRQILQRRSQPRKCSMRLFNVGLSTAMNLGEVDLFDKLEMIPCGGHLAAAGGIPSSQEWSH